jgi:hypothetical protein
MTETAKKPDSSKKSFGYIGLLAFFAGMILAIVGGIGYHDNSGITLALVIMGILVGVLNITGKEVLPLLIAAIALIVISGFSPLGGTGPFQPLNHFGGHAGDKIDYIVYYLAVLMSPAAIISAIRAIWAVARPGD